MDGGVEQRKTLMHTVLQRGRECESRLVRGRGCCWCRRNTSSVLGCRRGSPKRSSKSCSVAAQCDLSAGQEHTCQHGLRSLFVTR